MKLAGILAGVLVSGYASFALANPALVVKPRPSTPAPRQQVAPRTVNPSSMNAARGTGQSLESLKAAQSAPVAGVGAAAAKAANDNAVVSCSLGEFASRAAKGSRYQPANVEYFVEQELITQGNCGGPNGLADYPVEAKDNFFGATEYVSENVLKGRKVSELSGVEIRGLDMAWATGLAKAKNLKADNDNQVTVESQIEVARKIKTDCELRRN